MALERCVSAEDGSAVCQGISYKGSLQNAQRILRTLEIVVKSNKSFYYSDWLKETYISLYIPLIKIKLLCIYI